LTDGAAIGLGSVPCLAAHMRLRHDRARDSWTIQAPERSFFLDPIAYAIVSRCDGKASVAFIVEQLCAEHPDAPPDIIQRDVLTLIEDLVEKGVMAR
jgi:pyrroloquinoline quinone biosynthesis protein D